jgi:guanylate kinase
LILLEIYLTDTSRSLRNEEGNAYLHMDRNEMEADVEAGGFLEHGLHGEHLYGTKFDSVRRIIQSSKMCVLDIEPTVRIRVFFFNFFKF